MPELPEIETVRRGLSLHLTGTRIRKAVVRQRHLRRPVTRGLEQKISGLYIKTIARRAKYLLIKLDYGYLIYHLGMSGSLRIVDEKHIAGRHDHIDIYTEDHRVLRFCDPRKFGLVLWTAKDPLQHKLLRHLGPEPLGNDFSDTYLYQCSRGRKLAVKNFLMDGRIVVGIGNIYANEALFKARVHPRRATGRIAQQSYATIVEAVQRTLRNAIRKGGTTLRDFVATDGRPGYFKQALHVYQRAGEACTVCQTPIRQIRLAQRSTFYCPHCQH
ncbi:MAG: bifunctional DNA-formamidopyrimidine glycosylase/DNA-(apurinic or apyrimidinic site) lyase [Chromatiales bacterium]|nr:bifunctional DNA-formamidopyrimidine glycosylase/DNA-(apurinic or apyrimidinic site) lyase [Chromatiales bacterium]